MSRKKPSTATNEGNVILRMTAAELAKALRDFANEPDDSLAVYLPEVPGAKPYALVTLNHWEQKIEIEVTK